VAMRSDKVTLEVEAKDLLSGPFGDMVREVEADVGRLKDAFGDLDNQLGESQAMLHERATGNKEVNETLEEQAARARELYELEIDLGSRAAATEEERLQLKRESLLLELDATVARAQELGATDAQIGKITELFIAMDRQIDVQLEATRAAKAGAVATTEISVAARAAAFAGGVLERAWVSLKRALFVAPLVAGVTLLVSALADAASELVDFGSDVDLAADRLKRLEDAAQSVATTVRSLTANRSLAALFPGAFGVDEMEAARERLAAMKVLLTELVQSPTGQGPVSEEQGGALRALGLKYTPGMSEQSALLAVGRAVEQQRALVDTLKRQHEAGEAAAKSMERLTQAQQQAAQSAAAFLRNAQGDARFAGLSEADVERLRFQQQAQGLSNSAGFQGDDFVLAAIEAYDTTVQWAELTKRAAEYRKEAAAAAELEAKATRDAAIAYDAFRAASEEQARLDEMQWREQFRLDFDKERLAIMQQLELSEEEQLDLLRMQTDAQREAISNAAAMKFITDEQAESLLALIDRVEAQGAGMISGAATPTASFDLVKTAEQQYRASVESLDDTVVSQFSSTLITLANDFDNAGEAAIQFALNIIRALEQIYAQQLALQIFQWLPVFGGGGPGGQPNPGGGAGAGPESGGGFGATEGGGGFGGGSGFMGGSYGSSYGGASSGSSGVTINVHVNMPIQAIDVKDFKAKVAENSRFVGDLVARELDTNAGLKHATRKIARSAG